ncbi:MAG TPA: hypothetical protein VMY37_30400 [Thermoguttaceae bacterium]|nr:hypothetical protein [Thermoguttaceae bacterium]
MEKKKQDAVKALARFVEVAREAEKAVRAFSKAAAKIKHLMDN